MPDPWADVAAFVPESHWTRLQLRDAGVMESAHAVCEKREEHSVLQASATVTFACVQSEAHGLYDCAGHVWL